MEDWKIVIVVYCFLGILLTLVSLFKQHKVEKTVPSQKRTSHLIKLIRHFFVGLMLIMFSMLLTLDLMSGQPMSFGLIYILIGIVLLWGWLSLKDK